MFINQVSHRQFCETNTLGNGTNKMQEYLKNNSMLKTTEVYNQVMRTSIFQAFTFLDSLHSFKCEAVQPVYSLNLTSFILVHKLFQTLQLPTFVPRNLMRTNQSLFYNTERFRQIKQKEKWPLCLFKAFTTFPGVLVGNVPSASFPAQSLSFCFPVFSCFLLLKRRIVAPPINPSPCERSQTYYSYNNITKIMKLTLHKL